MSCPSTRDHTVVLTIIEAQSAIGPAWSCHRPVRPDHCDALTGADAQVQTAEHLRHLVCGGIAVVAHRLRGCRPHWRQPQPPTVVGVSQPDGGGPGDASDGFGAVGEARRCRTSRRVPSARRPTYAGRGRSIGTGAIGGQQDRFVEHFEDALGGCLRPLAHDEQHPDESERSLQQQDVEVERDEVADGERTADHLRCPPTSSTSGQCKARQVLDHWRVATLGSCAGPCWPTGAAGLARAICFDLALLLRRTAFTTRTPLTLSSVTVATSALRDWMIHDQREHDAFADADRARTPQAWPAS